MSRSELRDERHRLHCVEGLTMREIARRQGVQTSSVMRSIHVAENHMDRPRKKKTPRDYAEGMPLIQRGWSRGYINERQLVAAVRIKANPGDVPLPPRLAALLMRFLRERSIERIERDIGVPRSGRAILALLLDTAADAHGAPTDG